MKKKMIILIIVAIILLLGIGMILYFNTKNNNTFKENYEEYNGVTSLYNGKEYLELDVEDNNKIEEISYSDILNKMESEESFVVFFGFPTCPWCRLVVEPLIEVSNNSDIEKIYYVNIEDTRNTIELDEDNKLVTTKQGNDDYLKLVDNISDILNDYVIKDEDGKEYETNMKRIFAPNIIAFKDGKAIYNTSGIEDEITDPYQPLTEEQNNNSKEIIKEVIEMIN